MTAEGIQAAFPPAPRSAGGGPLRSDDDEPKKDRDKEPGGVNLQKKLLETRTIVVSDTIDDKLARAVISQLLVLEADDARKPVTMFVNSGGGAVTSGYAIFDAMRMVACPVRTIG
ncbi:MAG: ATP-dependent Clp protease proteolytic subunit, partial [Planctomycetes bacterium]|nr:ATP-dependent Clp protease proteolytic subunit [Planctomycetota bacterium]